MIAFPLDPTGKPERPADRMMAVLACPWLAPARARVVAVLAFHDGTGGARLGLRRIAREAGLAHKRNAENLLKAAREDGVIDWQAGTGKAPNAYSIDYEALARARPSGALSAPLDGEVSDPVVARSDAPSGALSAPKPEEPESLYDGGAAAPPAAGGATRSQGLSTGKAESVAATATAPTRGSGRAGRGPEDGGAFQTAIPCVVPAEKWASNEEDLPRPKPDKRFTRTQATKAEESAALRHLTGLAS